MRRIAVLLFFAAALFGMGALQSPHAQADAKEDAEFVRKLQEMLDRTEKSTKIIRDQISENQSAPFLADLYMQLGDLLAQKSNVLYYLQMEKDKNTDPKVIASRKFSPVVQATEEAIGVYKLILKDFPKFDKRDKVMYRLTVSLKAIGDANGFTLSADTLLKEFPDSKEAAQTRLLLGQHFFDSQEYDKSLSYVMPIRDCKFPFERNGARYRIGLIYINQEKFRDALSMFERVATDDELKDDDNPIEVSLKTKEVKSNIKREALIDSVRAYTEVFKGEDHDPAAYYSKVAPTEILFQETIEKLAFRYIFLKNYNFAVKLLRTLAERVADSQKIMNIYQEVLSMIPIEKRIEIPVEEMQFVLERFNRWMSFYELPRGLDKTAYDFFETQIRELGTRAHDLAKSESDAKKKAVLLERARKFYLLYLGFFNKGGAAVKIAVNLGDVFFLEQKYLHSGTYYIRTYNGDFGPPSLKDELIKNAIVALQKKVDYSFYEQLRVKGLLVKAIDQYMALSPSKKSDSSLVFLRAKTIFEQGIYAKALPDLFEFMKRFPNSKDVESAGELIFEYHNIRSDFKGLVDWAGRIQGLNLPNPTFARRVAEVRSKAQLRRLDEQVKTKKGFDNFSQGKTYLETALSIKDESLRSAALEQALARSKSEKDVETFLKAAGTMAKKEDNATKRAQIINSMADETMAMGRFYRTLSIWKDVYDNSSYPKEVRAQTFEKAVKLSLMLKDWKKIAEYTRHPLIGGVGDDTRRSIRQQAVEVLESPMTPPPAFFSVVDPASASDEELLSLVKAQYKLPVGTREKLISTIKRKCPGGGGLACKWAALDSVEDNAEDFARALQSTKPTLENVEKQAQRFNGILNQYKAIEASGDAHLDIITSLRTASLYDSFANFLFRVSQNSPREVKPLLDQKAQESKKAGAQSRAQCKTIIQNSGQLTPANKYCGGESNPSIRQLLQWKNEADVRAVSGDPTSGPVGDLQKKIFVDRKNAQDYLDLAERYLKDHHYQHAAATAVYGMTTFSGQKGEFSTILGCSAVQMGLFNEAAYHFKNASDYNGLKRKCESQMKARSRDL